MPVFLGISICKRAGLESANVKDGLLELQAEPGHSVQSVDVSA